MSPRMPGLEAWLVTGSQHLYGPDVLERVGEHARAIAACLDEAPEIPVTVVAKPVVTTPDGIAAVLREADGSPDCVGVIAWMHTFSPAKMWIAGLTRPAQAAGPPAHAVQPRSPVGGDRHGLHEPPPVRARRPGVRVHPDAAAARPQDGRRALAGPAGLGAPRLVGAGRGRLARVAPAPDRAVRRQHARGRGHRRRQGRGAGPARASRSTATASPTSSSASRRCPRPRSTPWSTRTPPTTSSRRRCARAATATPSCGRRPGSRAGLRSFLVDGGFGAFTDTFEDLGALAQLPGHRRPAADGRRLRLRRRGRLEGRRAGADPQGGGRRACPAARRSWRTTPTTWATRSPRCSVPTCSRSAPRSPPASRRARSTRCRSAAAPTRCGWCSTPRPGPASSSASPTSATASGSSPTRWTSSSPTRRCRDSPSRARSGGHAPTCRPPPRPGSRPAARTTPRSRRRCRWRC